MEVNMSKGAVSREIIATESNFHCSEDMKLQLQKMSSSAAPARTKSDNLKIVTFDSDLEKAVPDRSVVQWSKATCC
jgi:hypothetical protein